MKKETFYVGADRGGTLTRIAMLDRSLKLADSASFDTEEDFQAFAGKLCSVLQEWNAIDAPLVIASRGAFSRQEVREGIASAVNAVFGGKANLKAVISDAEAAHYAAFGGENGILLISGTGAVALSGRYGNYAKHGGDNPVGGDPGSGRWLGRRWLVYKGKLQENEEMDHAESASYAKNVLENAENAYNLNKQGKNKSPDEEFCLGIARQGAEHLSVLVRMAAAADRQAVQGGFIYAAYQGGTMQSRFYRELLSKCYKTMYRTELVLFPLPVQASEAAAMLAAKL